ncbi:uncharacterized protein ACLA_093020 [Aspergillus clavatus NRRL 1]|uniref:Integral membrane protein n=1 Tax=Aspergillus clavatus (strain ATCC 1007 / CBS 513.65 / DSM 816 / NCTC 3887 / NRRL 1 / QM 1276 / 107) TaxID=344612 RepID=A1CFF4_ASPCL|nr:uncharacterized protein ACLA_093020 [Aspergillus clavatus NRRL 1]EAW11603.1 integral membrane protein [Aspergillus clavatus NRRL 1]
MDPGASIPADEPSVFNYVLSFLLVGVAWGFTTPFIRRAAADFNARQEAKQAQAQAQAQPTPQQTNPAASADEQELQSQDPHPDADSDSSSEEDQPLSQARPTRAPAWMKPQGSAPSWLKTKIISVFWTVVNLLRTPAYAIPLVINLTGSIWFFLLVGKHELSLTVPLANSSAFLFTVLGEWYVERKVIAKETWLGMALVLGGIGLCVQSKNM